MRDSTGNRRWWPVRVAKFDLELLRRDRDQLWAEAAHREAAGESIRLATSLYAAAAREQEGRVIEDPFLHRLTDVLRGAEDSDALFGKIRSSDVWEIVGVPEGQRTQDQNERLGAAMRKLGWERVQRRFGCGPEYAYQRGLKVEERGRTIELVRDDKHRVIGAELAPPF